MNIYEKLNEARIRLQELNLKKSGKNKFAGFSYYELADFIPSVNQLFTELRLSSMFSVKKSMALLRIVNAEKPEEHVVFDSPTASIELKGCTAIQAVGAVHTYMKRYLYMNALEIVEHDALDAAVGTDSKQAVPSMSYEKTINNIGDVTQLNSTYRWLAKNAKDMSWKTILNEKAKSMNCGFDTSKRSFQYAV